MKIECARCGSLKELLEFSDCYLCLECARVILPELYKILTGEYFTDMPYLRKILCRLYGLKRGGGEE